MRSEASRNVTPLPTPPNAFPNVPVDRAPSAETSRSAVSRAVPRGDAVLALGHHIQNVVQVFQQQRNTGVVRRVSLTIR